MWNNSSAGQNIPGFPGINSDQQQALIQQQQQQWQIYTQQYSQWYSQYGEQVTIFLY